ncbi:MAG TPA: porin [Burkholderiales bacterium]|nr:porin [Burkholderiales bacterium]
MLTPLTAVSSQVTSCFNHHKRKIAMLEKKLLAAAVAGAFALPMAASAEDAKPAAPAGPAIPTLSQVLDSSGITINGYIDTAYSHLSGTGLFSSGAPDRVFDTEPNSFNLHQAAVTIAKTPTEGFGGVVNLTAGRDAKVIHSFDTTSESQFDVTQAYGQYAHGALTVIAGKYVTSAGAEVINSTNDVNYSRSILFGYAIPFTHTGLRATYAVNDKVSVFGGLNNGWDDVRDTNKQKTLELGFSVTPIKPLTIAAVDYAGTERVGGLTATGPEGMRNILDLVATYTVTDKLSFTLNYDYGSQDKASTVTPDGKDKAKWSGLAGYVTYLLTDTWRLAVRGEYFDDKDGYRTGVVQKWKEATVTLAYLPSKNMEFRGEVRGDKSDKSSFVTSDNGTTGKTQSSYGVEAIYKF